MTAMARARGGAWNPWRAATPEAKLQVALAESARKRSDSERLATLEAKLLAATERHRAEIAALMRKRDKALAKVSAWLS